MRTTKKAAPKKAAIKPINRYGIYAVTRTATKVRFGCGAVSVNKADLRVMSALVLDKQAVAAVKTLDLDRYRGAHAFVIPDVKGRIDTKTILNIGRFMVEHPVYFRAISRVKGACGTRQTIAQLLAVPSQTYLGLIGD